MDSKPSDITATSRQPRPGRPVDRLRLILAEPEHLLRWSLTEYLNRWFEVIVVHSLAEACDVMDHDRVDAAVVSDAWPTASVEQLETRLHKANDRAPFVRLVTDSQRFSTQGGKRQNVLEKPFRLGELARRLGVNG